MRLTSAKALLMGLALVAAAAGCDSSPPPTAKSPPQARNSPAEPPVEKKSPVVEPPPPASETQAPFEAPPTAGKDANATPPTAAEKSPAPPTPTAPGAERIALLTPGGPLLVDIVLTVDGSPYDKEFESQLDKVLAAADDDGDGRATWQELIANDAFLKSPLASAADATRPQKLKWIEDYDRNANEHVEREEAASWLGRGSGRMARAFAVRSTRSYRPDPRTTSRLWPLLDADADGRLSALELRHAADALLPLDADDDLTLAAAEVVPLRDQLLAAGGRSLTGRGDLEHFAALHLEPDEDIARLEYLLTDLYAPRQDLRPSSFSALGQLGAELDADGDDWLSRDELAKLLTVEPQLRLTVAFGGSTGPGATPPTVSIESRAPEAKLLPQTEPGRATVLVGGTRVVISAHDLAGVGPASPAEYGMAAGQRHQIRLLAFDKSDAVFAELDGNADGRLSERELGTVRQRLLALDADQDRELAVEELPYSMIVALVRGEAAGEESFYVPPLAPAPREGAPAPPWFTHADLNGDGDVSRREFLGTADQFSGVDLSRDGYIDEQEASQSSVAP